MVGAFVFPDFIVGITNAPTTLKLFIPFTFRLSFTTEFSSSPILHVFTG